MSLSRIHVSLAAVAIFCCAARGGEDGRAQGPKVTPELKPDAALVEKIADLPENTWLKLPPVKTAGDLSGLKPGQGYHRWGPLPRDYCNKMVWAPDRKRALYCGGGHNFDPGNDVWEYDLAANTWACLYAADKIPPRYRKDGKDRQRVKWYKENAVLKKDRTVTGKRGGPRLFACQRQVLRVFVSPCEEWGCLGLRSQPLPKRT
jgi:hypothetical protein